MRERPYQKLIVWREAHALCLAIYKLTNKFPADEKFSLVKQMRRSAYSIPMNIAEGNAKRTKKDHSHFIDIAIGSLEELHYQCLLAKDLSYCLEKELQTMDDHMQRIGFLLMKLRASLQ